MKSPMNSWLRHLLACLLMASIPIQGLAASQMLFCAMAKHANHLSAKVQLENPAVAPPCHGSLAQAASANVTIDATTSFILESCSDCELCCHLSVLPQTDQPLCEPRLISVSLKASFEASPEPTLGGFRKPPRPRLA
jgi:hypothetical protein